MHRPSPEVDLDKHSASDGKSSSCRLYARLCHRNLFLLRRPGISLTTFKAAADLKYFFVLPFYSSDEDECDLARFPSWFLIWIEWLHWKWVGSLCIYLLDATSSHSPFPSLMVESLVSIFGLPIHFLQRSKPPLRVMHL